MIKKVLLVIAVVLLAAAVYGYGFARDIAAVAGGYVSQTICTNVVMLGREQAEVEAWDLSSSQKRATTSTVNGNRVDTTVDVGPLSFSHSSVHRAGLGCSTAAGQGLDEVGKIGLKSQPGETGREEIWPSVTTVAGVDAQQLEATLAEAFNETVDDYYSQKNSRAVLVHYKGELIAERYADGFDGNTPLRGMSMTKSVSATLVGILVGQGKLDIQQRAPVRGWAGLDDARKRVTTHHLLTMTAGFDYREAMESDPRNLLNRMLYAVPDAPGLAARTPLRGEPGNSWEYQTVHSVLLQEVIRNTLGDDQAYFRFPREALFDKLDMHNSFFQADAKGTFIGGASMYASGRDWLKLGLLYLNDGIHDGKRVLPEGWVEYATTASEPSMRKRAYGAQIWLNSPSPHQLFPGVPEDAYAFQGHYGQYVIIIPSLELVVVRLGMTFNGEEGFDKQAFLKNVLAALPHCRTAALPHCRTAALPQAAAARAPYVIGTDSCQSVFGCLTLHIKA